MSLGRFHTLTVADVRRETADAVSVALRVPDALRDEFAYAPGQYLTLRTRVDGEELRRSYSISSGLDDGELRVAIKRVEGGRFSEWANDQLRAGDPVDVMPPAGRFTVLLDPAAGRSYAGFAAGSGITPVIAILRSVLAREPASRFSLFYGSRSTSQILFREALEDLKDRFLDRLSVFHVLSREQQDVPVLNGHLDADKVRAITRAMLPASRIDHAFICGPAAMIDAVSTALADAGVPPGRIHSERFSTGAPAVLRIRPAAEVETPYAVAAIVADGVRTEVPVAEGETVLDAALRAGLDLPYSCRGGMCSTCRARMADGAVRMDVNYGLEPWETEAGYVLTCQAHPTTPRVTVDYDHV